MRVHYINLDWCEDRRDTFLRINRHLSDVVRLSAVDGRSADLADLTRRGLVSADILTHYNLGAVGAALSHSALWLIAAHGNQPVTGCEDDAIFNLGFEARAEEVIRSLPDDWDLIAWGWNFDAYTMFEMLPGVSYALTQFEQSRMRGATEAFQNQTVSPRAFRLLWSFGSVCYSVSPQGGRTLLERLLPFRPIWNRIEGGERVLPFTKDFKVIGIDGALNSVYRDLNAYICFPPLAISKNELSGSTIQTPEQAPAAR